MTRLEKAKELHPEFDEARIIGDCPEGLLPINPVPCPIIEFETGDQKTTMCQLCWDNEFKEGEQA
jgi:hypothetical protein